MRIGNPDFVLGVTAAAEIEAALRREGGGDAFVRELLKPGCFARIRDVLTGRTQVILKYCVVDGRTMPPGLPEKWIFSDNNPIGELRLVRKEAGLFVVDESGAKLEYEIKLVPYSGEQTPLPSIRGARHLPAAIMRGLLESQYLIPGSWRDQQARIRFLSTIVRKRDGTTVEDFVPFMYHNYTCWVPDYESFYRGVGGGPWDPKIDMAAVLVPCDVSPT